MWKGFVRFGKSNLLVNTMRTRRRGLVTSKRSIELVNPNVTTTWQLFGKFPKDEI